MSDEQLADDAEIPGFWTVIPAGGAGTRLWPLSRATNPKFLLDLTDSGRTLLQATVDRLDPLSAGRTLIVTGVAHQEAVRAQVPNAEIVAEPSPRDSMAAIALAAALVERKDPQAVIGSFAADHVIPDADAFGDSVRTAAQAAREGWLVTIGLKPVFASTAFGYIHLGEPLHGHDGAYVVRQFVEKPSREVAEQYLASGEYRWNASMFVVGATTLLDLLHTWHPELADGVRAVAAEPSRMDEIWPTLERIAIDYAVAEPAADAGRVAVVPAAWSWDDVGDFKALGEMLPVPESGPRVLGDAALVSSVDADGLVVPASGRTVAVVGIDDVVVVDTPDAVLITTSGRAQDVKKLVDRLQAGRRTDLV